MKTPVTNPFFATRSQVVDLARRRYFEDGVPPAGVISEAVFQSWARCQRLHVRPERQIEFQPVTQSRALSALQRNRTLHEAWQAEVPSLQMLLGTTSCAAMLTDATGVLIGAACAGRPHENLMPVATRLGVNLSEEAVGTTAPGVVVRTGQPVCVLGSEHFFERVRQMHCAAAPIRGIDGSLAGVLDLSSEAIEFGFDAASVVGHLACTIENRLLIAQSMALLILRIQVAPPLLDSSTAGLVGIRPDGRVAWVNSVASRLLGVQDRDWSGDLPHSEPVLGTRFERLASMPRDRATVLSLPNGLSLWARPDMRGRQGGPAAVQAPVPAARAVAAIPLLPQTGDSAALRGPAPDSPEGTAPTQAAMATNSAAAAVDPQTVQTTHEALVRKALQESGGNLSKAARRLGVSRGWIYRRMQNLPAGSGDAPGSTPT